MLLGKLHAPPLRWQTKNPREAKRLPEGFTVAGQNILIWFVALSRRWLFGFEALNE